MKFPISNGMVNEFKYESEKWVDIDHGTPEEIHKIMDQFGIHPFVAKELTSTTPKPRIEFHNKYVYCILHFPAWKHTHAKENKNQEVDFIIGRDFLLTARYDTIDALHKLSKDLEVNQILDKREGNKLGNHVIFIAMIRELYGAIFEELEYFEDVIEDIKAEIFKGKEKEMVVKISETTSVLLDFKKTIETHGEIWEDLRKNHKEILGEEFGVEIEGVINEYQKINSGIRSNLEVLHELRDTNNSILTSGQNETIKKFTVIGSVLLILSIFISILFFYK